LQRGGGRPTENRVGRILKFASGILLSLVLLTLSCLTPPAHAATHHVNHPLGVASFFTHIATSANSVGNFTDLNNYVSNNTPDAFILATPKYSPYGVYDNHPIGVWYHAGRWSIFNQDGASMPLNAAFNVEAASSGSVHIATTANSHGDYTDLQDIPNTTGRPDVIVLVTPKYSPYGVYDNHPIGVWYHNGVWSIFNQDLTPIPLNAAFNVDVIVSFNDTYGYGGVQIATTANSAGDYTDLNSLVTNNNPSAIVFITPNFDPNKVVNNHNIGVWYHAGKWSIFNQDGAPIPPNAAFNVFAVPAAG
jgi:hypothetical protein